MSSIKNFQRLLKTLSRDRDATKALLALSDNEIFATRCAISDILGLTSAHLGDGLMHKMIYQRQCRLREHLETLLVNRDDLLAKIARTDKRAEIIQSRLKAATEMEERKEHELTISERVTVRAAQASGKQC